MPINGQDAVCSSRPHASRKPGLKWKPTAVAKHPWQNGQPPPQIAQGWTPDHSSELQACLDSFPYHQTGETVKNPPRWWTESPPTGRHSPRGICGEVGHLVAVWRDEYRQRQTSRFPSVPGRTSEHSGAMRLGNPPSCPRAQNHRRVSSTDTRVAISLR